MNTVSTSIHVHIGQTISGVPINLTATVINQHDGLLNWQPGSGAPPAGYNIYRDASKINTALVTGLTYTDAGLVDGTYIYTVRSINGAGVESADSNAANLTINTTLPVAAISFPTQG